MTTSESAKTAKCSQLWEHSSATFELKRSEERGRLSKTPAPRLAAFYWPDGRSCWQVNAYLIWLCARRRTSSTANTYGVDLSLLIRFIAEVGVSLETMDDDLLVKFANWMLKSGRKGTRVNQVLHRALKFLEWYQYRYGAHRKLVGFDGDGAQITVELSKNRRGRHYSHAYAHPAMTNPSVPRTVVPMPMAHIEALQNALPSAIRRSFTRARNGAMLSLFIEGGLRRTELGSLTTERLKAALSDGTGLKVRNAKRVDASERIVPIDISALSDLEGFLKHQREVRMQKNREKNPSFRDPGWLFCKENGEKLSDASITKIFSILRKSAGITSRAHPHMLRHRWITLQLVRMLKELQQLGAISADLLVTLLSRLALLAGHKDPDSLWNYVDFAAEEMMLMAKDGNRNLTRDLFDKVLALLNELENGNAILQQGEEMAKLVRDLRAQLAAIASQPDRPPMALTTKLQ